MSCEEDPGKRVGSLRVVLTPVTRVECRVYLDRLQRRKAATRDVECKACAERVREKAEAKRRELERVREWKKANPEKVREQKRKWREKNREKLREQKQAHREKVREQKQAHREKAREQKQRYRQANREKVREQQRKRRQANPEKVREWERKQQQAHPEKRREQKQRWRENNPEKVKAQKQRWRAKRKADEERMRVAREKAREQKRRYREANREKLRERLKRWRQANPEKFKAQRKRSREAANARTRRYHETHREEHNQARRERYYKQQGRPVPPPPPSPPPPPCDCGMCLACGGWGASWKPAWHARLNAFSAKKDPLPAVTLEELPLDLLESEAEAETLSIASTSEIDSELGDRLDALLADESDSEGETMDKVEAPTRRSSRIATMPSVSYQDWEEEEENPMWEFLKRKAQLHAEAEDRIVTRWEMLQHRTERVDAIVEEMSMGVDPTRQLDRFHSQLERQDGVLDVMVSEDLLDFVDDQLLL